MKKLILACLAVNNFLLLLARPKSIHIQVDASKQIAKVTKYFSGTNIEDLNNQINGGIFSQLLHGEAFEEGIDVDLLNLSLKDYVKVYVVLDEMKRPHLLSVANAYTRTNWKNLNGKYGLNTGILSHTTSNILKLTTKNP